MTGAVAVNRRNTKQDVESRGLIERRFRQAVGEFNPTYRLEHDSYGLQKLSQPAKAAIRRINRRHWTIVGLCLASDLALAAFAGPLLTRLSQFMTLLVRG